MAYRGFTWNMTYADANRIAFLLEKYVLDERVTAYKVDQFLAQDLRDKAIIFMELSPDGTSPTHPTADA